MNLNRRTFLATATGVGLAVPAVANAASDRSIVPEPKIRWTHWTYLRNVAVLCHGQRVPGYWVLHGEIAGGHVESDFSCWEDPGRTYRGPGWDWHIFGGVLIDAPQGWTRHLKDATEDMYAVWCRRHSFIHAGGSDCVGCQKIHQTRADVRERQAQMKMIGRGLTMEDLPYDIAHERAQVRLQPKE